MLQRLLIVAACMAFTGCASIVNDATHPVKVETLNAEGKTVAGADCSLSNDYGKWTVKSGNAALVHRSSKDLEIVCTHPDNPGAQARAVSRANGGMFGNILIGGGIGAIIDHNNGSAYTYPTWVQLVFGKTLVFDRRDEREGTAVAGTEPIPPTASK